MAVDYDLVVLGWTVAAQQAAQQAAQRGARVAWVQGWCPLAPERSPRYRPLLLQGLLTLRPSPQGDLEQHRAAWQECQQRAHFTATLLTQDDPETVRAQGVDVIAEAGQVTGDRPLRVVTATRHLTTRTLLVATGRPAAIAPNQDPDPSYWLTQPSLPPALEMAGNTPLSLVLAQYFKRWGVAVTLTAPERSLVSLVDPDVADWLLAHLQADGVVFHDTPPTKGNMPAPTTAPLPLASVIPHPSPSSLKDYGLDRWFACDRPLPVNRFLRTHHPRIYACGSVLGGVEGAAIAAQEAQIAVDNALFWPHRCIDYRTLPYHLPTVPPLAQVGLTEPQAKQRYGQGSIRVARIPLHSLPLAQWRGTTTGFCKLIAHRNGQLLGAHGAGVHAPEWIQTIALLIAQRCPWWAMARQSFVPDSALAILHQAVQGWEGDRWQPGTWRRDGAENWFNWRRSQ